MPNRHDSADGDETNAEDTKLHRREFMVGTGAAGVGLAIPHVSNMSKNHPPIEASQVQKWNREVDVVVIGYGGAGAAAAFGAAEMGADVLALEMREAGGGTTAEATGIVYMGGGTALQEALGVSDSTENMFEYLNARDMDMDDERLRIYCENSPALYDWLVELGVPFPEQMHTSKATTIEGGGLSYCGSELSYPYNEIAEPAPRGHKIGGEESNTSNKMFDAIDEAARGMGVSVEVEAPGRRLIENEDGRIVGVQADIQGTTEHIRANDGVIITTGGFCLDRQMIADHAREFLAGIPLDQVPAHDGSGIRMGEAVGGQVINMDNMISVNSIYPFGEVDGGTVNEAVIKGIIVNGSGRRFESEDRYGGDYGYEILKQHGGVAYLIMDDALIQEAGGVPAHLEDVLLAQADTVADLAESLPGPPSQLGDDPSDEADMEAPAHIPTASLENTLSFYNTHAENGEDPEFHKVEESLQPLDTPPYYAFSLRPEDKFVSYLTTGGLKVNTDGQIINAFDTPIEGVYGASRAVSDLGGQHYESGMSLGTVVFFGRRTGQVAAGGEPTWTLDSAGE